jgi:hypothetical protein
MPAVRPDCAAAREELVHVTGDARFQAVDTRREGATFRGFHDEVHVVRLDREVDDAEAVRGLAGAEGGSESDVHRVAEVVARASAVRSLRMRAGLATGVEALATPRGLQREFELLGAATARHLN